MRRFLFKLFLFSVFPLLSLLGLFLLDNGTADPFYQRVIGGRKKSLVIGTSKVAQGIVPSVLNSKLDLIGEDQLYNFGFTVVHSPFGESYNKAIQKKVAINSDDGIFIIAVDPWSFSTSKLDPDDKSKMPDEKLFLGQLHSFSTPINLEYLLKDYSNSFYEILLRYFVKNSMHLMEDGWLKTTPFLEEERFPRIYNSKVKEYEEKARRMEFSDYRFSQFIDLLDFLSQKGRIFIIVMPVDSKIYEIENSIFPQLIEKVKKESDLRNIPFKDFNESDHDYKFLDGVHLLYQDAEIFSSDLADWIL